MLMLSIIIDRVARRRHYGQFQGIVAFHQGHRGRAAQTLLGVEAELRALDVPDDALAEVVALGYTDRHGCQMAIAKIL